MMIDNDFKIDTNPDRHVKVARDPISMPNGVQVERSGNELFITRRWICAKNMVMAVFGALWFAAYLAFIFHVFIGTSGSEPMSIEGISDVFLLGIFSLVTLAVAYWSLVLLINKTYVRIDEETLTVRHGPLPCPRTRNIPISLIRQLFCSREQEEAFGLKVSSRGAGGTGGASYMYVVNAVLSGGRKIRLVAFVMEHDQARFIEQEIESHLGIEDRHVPGSMKS